MKFDSLKAVQSVLTDRHPISLPAEEAATEDVAVLYKTLMDLREFLLSIIEGDLSQQLRQKGYLAGVLKSLQANLRHLTWQTQRISQGDFTQRVDFMGDFSTAFNAMALQLKETREQLEEVNRLAELRADTDGLTGLYNHVYLMNTLDREMAVALRYSTPLSIVMIDIDYFKKFNDTYGHQTGDDVLRKVAELVRATLRQTDTAGRYGGEEFMLVLPQTNHAGAMQMAERLRSLIESTPFTTENLKVTISAGVAELSGQKPVELIQLADDRMYEAKRNGRNRVVG